MSGADVKNVQQALISAGYSVGSKGADGEYGADTESAVKKFQLAKGLTADGIVGKNTCTALGGVWAG
jgi:peptidoglycan hydrolase-like protein with peptidoglycan-binding domain